MLKKHVLPVQPSTLNFCPRLSQAVDELTGQNFRQYMKDSDSSFGCILVSDLEPGCCEGQLGDCDFVLRPLVLLLAAGRPSI